MTSTTKVRWWLAAVEATWATLPRVPDGQTEVHVSAGELPWLDYLSRARQIIDGFYPDVVGEPGVGATLASGPM